MTQMRNWEVSVSPQGALRLLHAEGMTFQNIVPAITVAGGEHIAPDASWDITTREADDVSAQYALPGRVTVRLAVERTGYPDWLALGLAITNASPTPLAIQSVEVMDAATLAAGRKIDWFLHNGAQMVDFSALVPLGERRASSCCAGFTDRQGNHAAALGFGRLDHENCWIAMEAPDPTAPRLTARVDREGIPLAPGATLELPPLLVGAGESLADLMHTYAAQVGKAMNAILNRHTTGWCSWYDYYGTETEADIYENVDAIAASPLKGQLRVIQIDDGWNLPQPGHARVWGDWHPGAKFPKGMKAVADRIHRSGFEAGIWLAPFAVDPASQLFLKHPDWLIANGDGTPKDFWGVYGLDLSQDAVVAFVRETFERVFNEWGYDYIKIDFLLYALFEGRRKNPEFTTAECYRRGLAAIREVAGKDRFVLCCGAPMGPSIGLCDAQRLGMDVSSRWSVLINPGTWPVGNCCVKAGAYHPIWRHWMQGTWWTNDPDCLQVRENGSKPEIAMFGKEFGGEFATEPPFGLSFEEAACWTRLIWLTGGLTLISENLGTLSPERRELLLRAFPENRQAVQWVDWYEGPEVVAFRTVEGPLMVGLFNLTDQPVKLEIPARKIGVNGSWRFVEWLDGSECAGEGAIVSFPEMPARSGRIWTRQG